jgi:hypothetical protein
MLDITTPARETPNSTIACTCDIQLNIQLRGRRTRPNLSIGRYNAAESFTVCKRRHVLVLPTALDLLKRHASNIGR